MTRRRVIAPAGASLLASVVLGLGAPAPAAQAQRAPRAPAVARLVDSLVPYVEGASGLTFLHAPRPGTRTPAESRAYVAASFAREFPAARVRAVATAYHLLGLLPDTTGLGRRLVELYGEQLRGYYDPDTDSLFVVAAGTASDPREVLIHEMVHAAQAQHTDLRALRERRWTNDERSAVQGLIEGQATFATMRLLSPRRNIVAETNLWDFVTAYFRRGAMTRPAYRRAPLWLREGLLAPYVYGAQFASWWNASKFADTLPYGPRLPASTEQLLHFPRYEAGDRPVRLRFAADSDATVLADDVVGELEIQMLAAQLAGAASLGRLRPLGWGGDRYRVYESPEGPALVWYLVWDDPESAEAFGRGTGARLAARRRAGYRAQLDTLSAGGRPAHRYLFAPEGWAGWAAVPAIVVMRPGR